MNYMYIYMLIYGLWITTDYNPPTSGTSKPVLPPCQGYSDTAASSHSPPPAPAAQVF